MGTSNMGLALVPCGIIHLTCVLTDKHGKNLIVRECNGYD